MTPPVVQVLALRLKGTRLIRFISIFGLLGPLIYFLIDYYRDEEVSCKGTVAKQTSELFKQADDLYI